MEIVKMDNMFVKRKVQTKMKIKGARMLAMCILALALILISPAGFAQGNGDGEITNFCSPVFTLRGTVTTNPIADNDNTPYRYEGEFYVERVDSEGNPDLKIEDVRTLGGLQSCVVRGNKAIGCTPTSSVDTTCDGKDDDCDGLIDEDYIPQPTTCGLGECASTGLSTCEPGGFEDGGCTEGTPTTEICDGLDNDCDGLFDEDFDQDGDGYTTCGTDPATGTSTIPDTNDNDPNINPGETDICDGIDNNGNGQIDEDEPCPVLTYYCDGDSDTFDAITSSGTCDYYDCVNLLGCSLIPGTDCNDLESTVHPGAPEICDGLDNDCDGAVDLDSNGDPLAQSCYSGPAGTDGIGVCQAGAETCTAGTWGACTGEVTPTGDDSECNGLDDNCDGAVDENFVATPTSCGVGACVANGVTTCIEGIPGDTCTPGTPAASDSTCDNVDDDCDNLIDEDYVVTTTNCGTGACQATGTLECINGQEVDSCSPGGPGADDTICNGIDDDCDGFTDEDYLPVPKECGVGYCYSTGSTACVGGAEVNNCVEGIPLSPNDLTCDAVDDNCNGIEDEDYLSIPTTCGVGACAANGVTFCSNGVVGDTCDPGTPAPDDATCDNLDDDCDGSTDEDYVSLPTSCGIGACAADGVTFCSNGVVEDTCTPGTPAPDDVTCDGIDDDCDALYDEDYVSLPTSCGIGYCAAEGATSCVGGAVQDSCAPGTPLGATDGTCDNVDDNCNGQNDEDYVSMPTICGTGSCTAEGATSCVSGIEYDSCEPGTPANDDATCDGIDNDCDGLIDEDYIPQPTTCGIGACGSTGVTSCVNGDEQDTCIPGTPAANDATCNNVDDDCDGFVDEDYQSVPTTCGVGACAADGATSCVGGVIGDSCTPGTPAASDATCDAVDDDCDGLDDEDYVSDPTICGVGACSSEGATSCISGVIEDSCTPGEPAADDSVCNGEDDDCDGLIDEDYIPQPTTCGAGACSATGQWICEAGSLVNTCTPGAPAPDDAICNGIDDDCNGETDEDYVLVPTICGVGACTSEGETSCVDGQEYDSCLPGTPGANDATCDGIDNDCDGLIDEDYVPQPTTCGIGACGSTGVTSCVSGIEYDSCEPGTPANDDATCNNIDNDCDGFVDEDYMPQPTTCGIGACASTGVTSCVDGDEYDSCTPGTPSSDDSVCDGIDNDCDGFIDEEYVPTPTTCGEGACAATGELACQNGQIVDTCVPGDLTPEVCDDVDNDCNGAVDDLDADEDGANDCFVDKCLGTILPEGVPTIELRPNHYAQIDDPQTDGDLFFEVNTGSVSSPVIVDSTYSLGSTYGCSCEQILFCKPGNNLGEQKYGCTDGTMSVWISQSAWSAACQIDGIVSIEGEDKELLENTDSDQDGIIDALDDDNDGDGVPDDEDSEPDSRTDYVEPDHKRDGKGKPDWWCAKHPNKC